MYNVPFCPFISETVKAKTNVSESSDRNFSKNSMDSYINED